MTQKREEFDKETLKDVMKAVLHNRDRQLILLRYWSGMTDEEIARVMRWSLERTQRELARVLKLIRDAAASLKELPQLN